jgi:hypothetical protein
MADRRGDRVLGSVEQRIGKDEHDDKDPLFAAYEHCALSPDPGFQDSRMSDSRMSDSTMRDPRSVISD